ncbi:hypothetical protein BC628DRAFT_1338925 [Trametes gibbosa]|nr:hypothetical protein BC628DRAFT_1338925 [Trametes gibbosa]
MPAFRNVRRSRRLSRQPPRDPGSDEFDRFDLELMYPASPATSPDAELPPPDETGEPEIDPDSPPSSPAHYDTPVEQRSSHSRKKKPGHIPRPPNAFMIFRSDLWNKEKIKSSVERDHRQISRIAGSLWNSLTDAERTPYHDRADDAKREHARKYPQYKYAPIYRRDKPTKRKPKQDYAEKVLRCHEVAQLIQRGFEGDDLKNELDRRAAEVVDSRPSGSSEYVAAPRSKSTVASKRSPSKAHPRRERRDRFRDDDEYLPAERYHVAIHSPAVKQEASASPDFGGPAVSPADGPEAYVPTSDIPPLDLDDCSGDKADNCSGVKLDLANCSVEKITFTNPFRDAGSSSPPFIGGSESLRPSLSSLSDDFLAPPVEKSLSPLHPSPSPGDLEDLIDSVSDELTYDTAYLSFSEANPYFDREYVPEVDFSDWMHYEE